MEGTSEQVADREKKLNAIAARYGGIPAGATNGENGYTLTFVIAYLRVSYEFEVARKIKFKTRDCTNGGLVYFITAFCYAKCCGFKLHMGKHFV